MEFAVQVDGVRVQFPTGFRKPPFQALRGLSLHAKPGEIVGILGPNGSGKTTLLRIAAGLLSPNSGTAQVLGMDPSDPQLVQRVGFQPEGALPFPSLSAREFTLYMGDLLRLPIAKTKAASEHWLERLGLSHTGKKPIRAFSTGMRKRLALAVALLADPELLLLDEPTSGLDPEGSLRVMEIFEERAAAGTTILLASHHLQEVEQVCDRVYLFGGGRVLKEGTLDELLGTGETHLVVSDLDESGLAEVAQAVSKAGGTVIRQGQERQHVFELFRETAEGQPES